MMTDARRPAISGGFGSSTRDADTMSCARILLALIASCVLLVLPAVAEKRVALVVGNSAYKEVSPLPNPVNDANDIAAALKASGFDVVLGVDVDKRDFDSRIRSFTQLLETADVAVLFYAGHGMQVGGRNYLIPVDAKLQSERELDFDAVSLDFILKQMELGRADKTNIVFLDACRDNPFSGNLARSMGTRSTSIGKGLAQAETGVGTFIAYSTQPGNVAVDGAGRNSPFTAALSKYIKESNHNLTSVMIDVRKDVLAATGGKQVPWDHSALTGEFFFKQTAAATANRSTTDSGDPETQSRLRTLEDEVKKKSDTEQTGNIVALAQARERLRQLSEENKADQQRIFDKQYETGGTEDSTSRNNLAMAIGKIQMQMVRRNQQAEKLREEIKALEGKLGLPPEKAQEGAEK
jgi:uncharacterized caspase-like protein